MPDPSLLTQLQQMLASDLIRKRKAGIAMAAEMLATDAQSAAVRTLLDDIAKNDAMLTVREAAGAALDADDKRRNPPPPDYVFGAECEYCNQITYLDKRVVCSNRNKFGFKEDYIYRAGSFPNEVVYRNGQEMDAIQVVCKHCDKTFKAFVPCEGYK